MSTSTMPDEWINPAEEFPEEDYTLLGVDSNAFSIMGHTTKWLKKTGNPRSVLDAYQAETMGGDYDNLLATSMRYLGMID